MNRTCSENDYADGFLTKIRCNLKNNVMRNYNKWLFILAITLFSITEAFSQSFSESKTYVHQFPLTPKTTVEISNKYGKVQLLTWNNDSVRIDIDFYIASTSQTRLTKLRNSINFDFTNSGSYVVVKTIFGNSQTKMIDEIKDFAEAIVSGSNEVRIDYTVRIPANQTVKVTNKYGDIYADDLTGDVQLNLSNGDLKANDMKGNLNLFHSFGNAFINNINKGRISAEYADLNIRAAQNITFETKSSKIRLDNGNMIKLQSRRDDITIDNATRITGDGYFSNIRSQNISEELSLSGKFGKIAVDNFSKNFSFVNITSEYTDIDLYFERGSGFDFDITYNKDVLLRLPKEVEKTEEKLLSSETGQMVMYGKVGSSENSKVKIMAPKKCYLNLYLK